MKIDLMLAKKHLKAVDSLLRDLPDFVKVIDGDAEINIRSLEERVDKVIEFLDSIE